MSGPLRSRLRLIDNVTLATLGLRARVGRSTLTALGIAIGIAAIVAVVGISASGRADLLARLDQLGTNLLRVGPGQGILGGPAELPDDAVAMSARIAPVQAVSSVGLVDGSVRRTDLIPELETGGLSLMAVEPDLLDVLGAEMMMGRFIDDGLGELPVAVLGDVAAERLGVSSLDNERLVYVDGVWFSVIGIAEDLDLHPDLERSAMIGYPIAAATFGDVQPTAVYLRVFPEAADDVTEVLPSTVNPENPDQVEITRPADALAAREAADAALTQLLLALGSVALLVGGVAIANVMVMSVLERRMEIGVRRALGATRGHIRRQFLLEAIILAGIGGVVGAGLGAVITGGYTAIRELPLAIPVQSLAAAVGAALVIGALAGLYPAARAARIPPSQAVRGSQ